MTLAALIRKRESGELATAIPATPATEGGNEPLSVARIATVAVANPAEPKPAKPCQAGAAVTASRWWLIHYANRDPLEAACCPEAAHADILERHPDAVAAEPFTPTTRQPSAPMIAEEDAALRTWLALIGETDPATVAVVIARCERDADAQGYFEGRSEEEKQP